MRENTPLKTFVVITVLTALLAGIPGFYISGGRFNFKSDRYGWKAELMHNGEAWVNIEHTTQ